MALLTKEAILAAQDIRYEEVSVPAWGGSVRVRSMSGADRDDWEQWLVAERGKNESANLRNLRARMIATSVVDESGNRLFTETDIPALGAKSATSLQRIYDVATRLNAIGDAEVAELVKPSAPAPGADSGSDSPKN